MFWKYGIMIGLKKKIGTRRRNGAGDKEVSGRTEDWEKDVLEVTIERSWNWEEQAALLLSSCVRLCECPDPLEQRKVVAIVCAAVPFSCFQCVWVDSHATVTNTVKQFKQKLLLLQHLNVSGIRFIFLPK